MRFFTLGIGFVLTAAPALAQRYELIDLGTLGGKTSAAYAVNDRGEAAGQAAATQYSHGFFHGSGGIVDLGTAGGRYSAVRGLNAQGRLVGDSWNSSSQMLPAMYENGSWTFLGDFGGGFGQGFDVNELGEMVGFSETATGADHPFLWSNGTFTDLGAFAGRTNTYAHAINEKSQIAGWAQTNHNAWLGFLWDNGSYTDLGNLGDPFQTMAYDLNDKTQVVGFSTNSAADFRAFLWENGSMQDLGSNGGDSSVALSINNETQIVGHYSVGNDRFAFLWERGQMHKLQDLIPPSPEWQLREAHEISNSGEIVGVGTMSGASRGFLLRPRAELVGPLPGTAGTLNTMRLGGMTPGAAAYFAYGPQVGTTNVHGCPSVTIDLQPPLTISPKVFAKANGVASYRVDVPARAAGRQVWIQAIDHGRCRPSPLIGHLWQ